jgi:hypothetical protein
MKNLCLLPNRRKFKEAIEGELSNTHSIAEFVKEMKEAAMECFRL